MVLHTPELMYYQNTPQSELLRQLVFVEIPYSQGPSFFTNLTIYHELGHYVFDNLAEAEKRSPAFAELTDAMERAFSEKLGQRLTTPSNRTWARRVLDAWTREVFCDLFAVAHLGPAFTFALIDVLSLIGLMGEEIEVTFDTEHPAAALRFREQLHRMKEDGWWTSVEGVAAEHVSLVIRLAAKEEYSFEYQEKSIPTFIEAFEKIIPFIHALVTDITPQRKDAAKDFGLRRGEVERCLLHGVVPSQLLVEGAASSPTPVSMINAAYCFYLTRLPDLMESLEEQDVADLSHRKNWIARLEACPMKGIEDYQLLQLSAERVPEVATDTDLPARERTGTSGVFAREEIEARLGWKVDDPAGLVITPLFDRKKAIDADSVDLRLGTYFLLPRSLPEAYFSPDANTPTSLHVKVHVPLGRYLVVPAHQTVLGCTLEFIKLPCDASGEVLTKSSIARTFIVVETAPWIHPEYRGCLTLEIANVSNTPVLLYPGRPIGQLILLHVNRRHDPQAKIKSSYFGPVHPEAPPFKNPEEDLRKIGIEETAVIRRGTMKDGQFWPQQPDRSRSGQ